MSIEWLRAFPAAALLVFSTSVCAPLVAQAAPEPVRQNTSEKSPPGDIPDSQVFVSYRSEAGYRLEVPEGWARRTGPNSVQFSDKYNAVEVGRIAAKALPVREVLLRNPAALLGSAPVEKPRVQSVRLPGGPALRVDYTSLSEPNPVTGRQIQTDNSAYLLYQDGKLAVLKLHAPLGADNIDQWQRMANSFRWVKP